MLPFYGLKFDDESMVFELKARKSFGENPILGKFEVRMGNKRHGAKFY